MFPRLAPAAALLALGLGPAAAQAPEAPAMTWPEAVELLARERQTAELCARVTKRFLPKAALTSAEVEYETARAEFNPVIGGLQAALIERDEEPALDSVEARVATGTEARRAFCEKAMALEPAPEPGVRSPLAEVLSGSVGAVVEAAVAVWNRIRDDDAERRRSLGEALEEAKWPAFAAIEP